jgi:parallel beta-helix repeat protein
MQKAEWRSRDDNTLFANGSAAAVSVNGMHMSATKSEGYDGGAFCCVLAGGGATLSLEGCDLTCQGDTAVAGFFDTETTGVMFGCCIHDGKGVGVVVVAGASATLENNNIHSNTEAGVQVQDEGSEAVLRGNRIHDGKGEGVFIVEGASATLESNTITDNDQTGVTIADHATATLTGNTITGNGQCKIELTEEKLATWPESRVASYRSPNGFPGVRVLIDSTATMPPHSNTIEGNGKVGSDGEQVVVDETSRFEA